MKPMCAAALLACVCAGAAERSQSYQAEIEKWRADREARLRRDDGWLTLTGLFWLEEGENAVGSGPGSRVELPNGPERMGVIRLRGEKTYFEPKEAKGVLINGKAPRAMELRTDRSGSPDVVTIGQDLTLLVIQRGAKVGVRLKDKNSRFRREFTRLRWFPVNQEWRVKGRFVPYLQPRKMMFDASAGDKQEMISPGYVEFTAGGKKLRLTPVSEDDQLFFIMRDQTAGKFTYPAARFLYAQPAKDGVVVLDFNKAYNPPCVFTPYATCPLPPPENRLPIAVTAGELAYKGNAP